MSASLITLARWALKDPARPFNKIGVAWFIGIGTANLLALLLLYLGLSRGPVATIAPIVATYPLITYAFTRFLLAQEPASRRAISGIALSVLGVILLTTL
ncbi:MAG: EamA family transporter [Arenibacterium sp.]